MRLTPGKGYAVCAHNSHTLNDLAALSSESTSRPVFCCACRVDDPPAPTAHPKGGGAVCIPEPRSRRLTRPPPAGPSVAARKHPPVRSETPPDVHRPSRPNASTDADPCRIEGGYAPVPAASLAALWAAYRSKAILLADARAWLALCSVEAGLRAAQASGTVRKGQGPSRDAPAASWASLGAVEAAYGGASLGKAHGQRVLRQRLRRLEAAGLAAGEGGGWRTAAPSGGAAADLLAALGVNARTARVPRRWLASLAASLTAGELAVAVAALLRCCWGRGGGSRRAYEGRVGGRSLAAALGLSDTAVRAGRRRLVAAGRLEPVASPRWSRRRWGERVRVRAGSLEGSVGARQSAVRNDASARRSAATDQTQTRLRRDQKPGPTGGAGAGVREGEAGRPESRGFARPSSARRGIRPQRQIRRPSDPWQGGDATTAAGAGRLYARLVAAGVVGEGPREAVRFFAAAARAREVGSRPLALLRWIVGGGRWEVITDRQDERGDREWKVWRRGVGGDPSAAWELDADEDPEQGPSADEDAERREEPTARTAPRVTEGTTRGVSLAPDATPRRPTPPAAPVADPADTIASWPADVRTLVGRRAMGKARGWDDAASDAQLARRDGWDAGRVRLAETAARALGLLDS